mmetsp:Transcript_5482/g.11556  ORF Transcript_5482/g.11556 Transcript_5482/m.11556 type:complete len:95 (-) Transcript_5482:328-612(-)
MSHQLELFLLEVRRERVKRKERRERETERDLRTYSWARTAASSSSEVITESRRPVNTATLPPGRQNALICRVREGERQAEIDTNHLRVQNNASM